MMLTFYLPSSACLLYIPSSWHLLLGVHVSLALSRTFIEIKPIQNCDYHSFDVLLVL